MIDEPWATDPDHPYWVLSETGHRARREAYIAAHGPCANCGSDEHLELDHINPEDKESHVGLVFYRATLRPEDVIELSKCRVLCRTCHRLRHTPLHGTVLRYKAGCRCKRCKEGQKREYELQRKAGQMGSRVRVREHGGTAGADSILLDLRGAAGSD